MHERCRPSEVVAADELLVKGRVSRHNPGRGTALEAVLDKGDRRLDETVAPRLSPVGGRLRL